MRSTRFRLAQCLVKRKTANNEYLNEYLASTTKINNMGIFVAILTPVSAQLIRTSDWDQNSGVRLVFGLSEKTNPKSEVAQCNCIIANFDLNYDLSDSEIKEAKEDTSTDFFD